MHPLGRRPRSLSRWRRVRRRRLGPVAYWTGAAALATLTGVLLATALGAAASSAARWDVRPVAVARHHLPVGTVVASDDVEVRLLPAASLPEGTTAEPPTGRTVRSEVVAGEPMVSARLAPDGASGATALAGPDRRVVAVPPGEARLAARTGDRVDLMAVVGADRRPDARPVAVDAPVVAVDEDEGSLAVAVRTDELPAVSAALVDGAVVVALVGAG